MSDKTPVFTISTMQGAIEIIKRLQEQLAAAVKALEFYSDRERYMLKPDGVPLWSDNGQVARKMLAEIEKLGKKELT